MKKFSVTYYHQGSAQDTQLFTFRADANYWPGSNASPAAVGLFTVGYHGPVDEIKIAVLRTRVDTSQTDYDVLQSCGGFRGIKL